MKKMLVSDFDGTIYINKKIRPQDKKSLDKIDIFVIATGRTYASLYKENSLKSDYLITDFGALIFQGKKIIYDITLDNEVKGEIINILLKYISKKEILISKGFNENLNINTNNINKIRARFNDKKLRELIIKEIKEKYNVTIYKTKENDKECLEIVSEKVNKVNAIKFIAKKENLKNENIYTIGDSYGDIEMINAFNGYIIKSAKKEMKEMCKREIESVSKLIEKIIKSEN